MMEVKVFSHGEAVESKVMFRCDRCNDWTAVKKDGPSYVCVVCDKVLAIDTCAHCYDEFEKKKLEEATRFKAYQEALKREEAKKDEENMEMRNGSVVQKTWSESDE